LSAFLVELGAPMIVASTIVPVPTFKPRACSTSPTTAKSASPSLCFSSSLRNDHSAQFGPRHDLFHRRQERVPTRRLAVLLVLGVLIGGHR
jgi:hypothetical protein